MGIPDQPQFSGSTSRATAPSFLIETRDLTKHYKMGGDTVRALEALSINIRPGEFVAVHGSSGSGKSTLLNLLGGLDRPTSGEILFEGDPLSQLSAREMAAYRLRKVGMIFQSFNLVSMMTAEQNVAIALAFAGVARGVRKQRLGELFQLVGLEHRKLHRPAELSGGEQQRVAIARALANSPRLLLADEPTGNLDTERSRELLGFIRSLCADRGIGVLLVTHEKELSLEFVDRALTLRDGRLVEA